MLHRQRRLLGKVLWHAPAVAGGQLGIRAVILGERVAARLDCEGRRRWSRSYWKANRRLQLAGSNPAKLGSPGSLYVVNVSAHEKSSEVASFMYSDEQSVCQLVGSWGAAARRLPTRQAATRAIKTIRMDIVGCCLRENCNCVNCVEWRVGESRRLVPARYACRAHAGSWRTRVWAVRVGIGGGRLEHRCAACWG